jgi:predicted DNA binding CopG/RHH family protein
MKKQLPRLPTDKAAEDFVATADLTDYDLSSMTPMHFEFQPKDRTITMRLSESLFEAIREEADRSGLQPLSNPKAVAAKMMSALTHNQGGFLTQIS